MSNIWDPSSGYRIGLILRKKNRWKFGLGNQSHCSPPMVLTNEGVWLKFVKMLAKRHENSSTFSWSMWAMCSIPPKIWNTNCKRVKIHLWNRGHYEIISSMSLRFLCIHGSTLDPFGRSIQQVFLSRHEIFYNFWTTWWGIGNISDDWLRFCINLAHTHLHSEIEDDCYARAHLSAIHVSMAAVTSHAKIVWFHSV